VAILAAPYGHPRTGSYNLPESVNQTRIEYAEANRTILALKVARIIPAFVTRTGKGVHCCKQINKPAFVHLLILSLEILIPFPQGLEA
jgi:hypothetical protein